MSSDDGSDGQMEVLLLTTQQVAQMCQVSDDKVLEWSRQPGFPAIRGKHQVRIHARLFLEWLEKRARDENGQEVGAA